MSYNERLRYLGLSSRELRRLHLDLIYCNKIVFGAINLNFSVFFEFSSVTATSGHDYKLYKPSCVNSTRSNFLPSSVNLSTLNAFKRSILFYLYLFRAAISGISVLAVLFALFCCTFTLVFLSQ